MENALAQEWKGRPAIALSFDQFQLGHVPIHPAIIDPPGETSFHCIFVFLDPSRKGLEFGKMAVFHLSKPGVKELSRTLAEHLAKLLHQVIGQIDFWTHLTEFQQGLLLFGT
jgi:hypothetical protein